MEDVYTIKVKTKPDTRNLYPSERRYSASTVSGLAWVHIALAATSFLLACLALVNPTSDIKRITLNNTEEKSVSKDELVFNLTNFEDTTDNIEITTENSNGEYSNDTNNGESVSDNENEKRRTDKNYILVLASTLLTIFALSAGIASIMASVRWYVDRNITWLFFMAVLSTIFSFVSFVMIVAWFVTTEDDISEFYKDKIPFKDVIIVKHSNIVHRNESHMIIKTNSDSNDHENSHIFTKRVLSINILIASFLELLWSILSVKISYKGMRNNYKEDTERRGNAISVVTTIKGNTKQIPRNGKIIPPKPDLIEHYPSTKIKRIFLAQSDNGFYLKNQNNKAKNTETSSEFYKERMMNFLNRCASQANNSEMHTPSEQSESVLNVIPENNIEVAIEIDPQVKDTNRITPVSWGDSPEHMVYNQNNINFEKIFNFKKDDKENDTQDEIENDTE